MSGVSVITELLHADAPLLALVPATQIFGGVIPQGASLPALGITQVSLVEDPTIDAQAPTMLVNERVQITVVANDYPEQKEVLRLARRACNYKRGLIAEVTVVSIRREADGPDFNQAETNFYMQSVDYRVTFHQPT